MLLWRLLEKFKTSWYKEDLMDNFRCSSLQFHEIVQRNKNVTWRPPQKGFDGIKRGYLLSHSQDLITFFMNLSASQASVLRNGVFFPKNNSIEKNHSCLCVCVQYPLQFVFTIWNFVVKYKMELPQPNHRPDNWTSIPLTATKKPVQPLSPVLWVLYSFRVGTNHWAGNPSSGTSDDINKLSFFSGPEIFQPYMTFVIL